MARYLTIKFLVGVDAYYDKWPGHTPQEAAEGWLQNLRSVADEYGFVNFTTDNGALKVTVESIKFVEAF